MTVSTPPSMTGTLATAVNYVTVKLSAAQMALAKVGKAAIAGNYSISRGLNNSGETCNSISREPCNSRNASNSSGARDANESSDFSNSRDYNNSMDGCINSEDRGK